MKTFYLKADATFEAEGIDDAFQRLSDHFKGLLEEGDSNSIFLPTSDVSVGVRLAEKKEPVDVAEAVLRAKLEHWLRSPEHQNNCAANQEGQRCCIESGHPNAEKLRKLVRQP